ncbi:leukocyte elastase inhibitor-like [Pomacea canaliculata]|uniref:leukocyte elastase inhibitor-like n=1 Tax=Pomacea canaliculata TaxID=400727 RepID=UPI000D739F0D|nr:leukocyte elastase inhibitor-like [Pomacea canaliculata]
MASSCGLLTLICLILLVITVVSSALTSQVDSFQFLHQPTFGARSARELESRGGKRRGHERVAVDGTRGQRRQTPRGARGDVLTKQHVKLIENLSSASAIFSSSLYSQLRKNASSDIVFSPFSVHVALTMTYLGAQKATAREMIKVLGLSKLRKNKAHSAYAALLQTSQLSTSVELNLANAVFVKPNLPVEETFRQGLVQMYRAKFGHFDFSAVGGPETPINTWVGNVTKGKIPDFLAPGTIDNTTAMIIVNALYFKGSWLKTFRLADTAEEPFYLDDGTTVTVPMMKQEDNFKYKRSQNLKADIVELPYKDQRYSIFIVLPVSRGTLSQVEQSLKMEELTSELESMGNDKVKLFLPRFKSKSRFSLKEPMKRLGMRSSFNTKRANFRGISSGNQLFISDVIHEAVVEVNEEGTEASAATAVKISFKSRPFRTVNFRADHPFLYIIRDNTYKMVLFMGRYTGVA